MVDNPAAFPIAEVRIDGIGVSEGSSGMALRDYFAAAILPTIAADLAQDRNEMMPSAMPAAAAKGAYMYADAMLAERSR